LDWTRGDSLLLKRTLAGIIRSFEQTGDAANDPALKTRYYKMPREKLWEEVISLLKKTPNYELLHEMESVGEIVLSKKNGFWPDAGYHADDSESRSQ